MAADRPDIRQIPGDGLRDPAKLGNRISRPLRRSKIHIGQNHAAPLLRERFGNGATQPTPSAHHQGGPAINSQIHHLFSCCSSGAAATTFFDISRSDSQIAWNRVAEGSPGSSEDAAICCTTAAS